MTTEVNKRVRVCVEIDAGFQMSPGDEIEARITELEKELNEQVAGVVNTKIMWWHRIYQSQDNG